MKKYYCLVEYGTELLSFTQDKDCVCAIMKYPNGEEHCVPYDFLVGTDGARGVVRKALNLTFLGETRNVDNMTVGDVKVEGLDSNVRRLLFQVSSNSFTESLVALAYVGPCGERLVSLAQFLLVMSEFGVRTG